MGALAGAERIRRRRRHRRREARVAEQERVIEKGSRVVTGRGGLVHADAEPTNVAIAAISSPRVRLIVAGVIAGGLVVALLQWISLL